MSHPTSQPRADHGVVDQADPPPADLFSHPPTAEAGEQGDPPFGRCVDWRAVPFSADTATTFAVEVADRPTPRTTGDSPAYLDQRHPVRR